MLYRTFMCSNRLQWRLIPVQAWSRSYPNVLYFSPCILTFHLKWVCQFVCPTPSLYQWTSGFRSYGVWRTEQVRRRNQESSLLLRVRLSYLWYPHVSGVPSTRNLLLIGLWSPSVVSITTISNALSVNFATYLIDQRKWVVPEHIYYASVHETLTGGTLLVSLHCFVYTVKLTPNSWCAVQELRIAYMKTGRELTSEEIIAQNAVLKMF